MWFVSLLIWFLLFCFVLPFVRFFCFRVSSPMCAISSIASYHEFLCRREIQLNLELNNKSRTLLKSYKNFFIVFFGTIFTSTCLQKIIYSKKCTNFSRFYFQITTADMVILFKIKCSNYCGFQAK